MSFDKQHVMGAAAAQATRREALIERIGYFADLLSTDPLEGDKGDVAYELLRQAAAQMSSDRLALEASSRQEERLREAIAYALPLVSKDIDDAMKVRRVSRDVIEELEGYERTLKAALEPPQAKDAADV